MNPFAALIELIGQALAAVKARRAAKAAGDLPRGAQINDRMQQNQAEIGRRAGGR